MATLNLAQISIILNVIFAESMAEQFRRDVLLPNILPVRMPTQANATATWPVKVAARTAGGAYAEGADAADADFDSHSRLQATLAWAQYKTGAKVSGLSEAISRMNGTNGINIGVFEEEMIDAIDQLAAMVSADLYGGDVTASPPEIEGLARAIDSSGTYAGINPATYTSWASAENTLARASLSEDNLRTYLIRPIKDACGMYPRVCICPGDVWDDIGTMMADRKTIVEEIMSVDGRKINLAAGGFRAILVDGVPFVEDRHCTTNTLYSLGPNAVEIEQIPSVAPQNPEAVRQVMEAMKALSGVELVEDVVRAMLLEQSQRLQPYIKVLGATGDNFKALVIAYLQLKVKYRNRCAKLTLT